MGAFMTLILCKCHIYINIFYLLLRHLLFLVVLNRRFSNKWYLTCHYLFPFSWFPSRFTSLQNKIITFVMAFLLFSPSVTCSSNLTFSSLLLEISPLLFLIFPVSSYNETSGRGNDVLYWFLLLCTKLSPGLMSLPLF